jgi:hypothetical protein
VLKTVGFSWVCARAAAAMDRPRDRGVVGADERMGVYIQQSITARRRYDRMTAAREDVPRAGFGRGGRMRRALAAGRAVEHTHHYGAAAHGQAERRGRVHSE